MKIYHLEEGADPKAFEAELRESGMSELQARAFALKLQEEGYVTFDEIDRLVNWIAIHEVSARLVQLGLAYWSFPPGVEEPLLSVAKYVPESTLETLDEASREAYKQLQAEARAKASERMH